VAVAAEGGAAAEVAVGNRCFDGRRPREVVALP
jgi:hypothetical protein